MTAKTLIKNVTSNSNPSPNKRPTTAKMSNARKGKTTIPAIIRIGNLTLLFITLYSPLIGLQHQFKRRARALREHPSSNSLCANRNITPIHVKISNLFSLKLPTYYEYFIIINTLPIY
jgi:hypothetical protein